MDSSLLHLKGCVYSFIEPEPPQTQVDEDNSEEKDGDADEEAEGEKQTEEGDEESVDEKPQKIVLEELPIDANHPEVLQIVNEVLAEADKREPELSPDEYTDVIEEAIQKIYAELQEMNPDGPQ